MNNQQTQPEFEIPKWDVAIEALLREEYQKRNMHFSTDDLQLLASNHGIRFDDIMVTLCTLVEQKQWRYHPAMQERFEDLNALFDNGRLAKESVEQFIGSWSM